MNENPKIGILTVLYNSAIVLEDFFRTLNLQEYKNFTLYVIDNNSQDSSLELAWKLVKNTVFETKIISHESNLGFAKANNIGIQQALNDQCDLILFANNDIVLKASTIKNLVQGMKSTGWDIVVPKILFYGSDLLWYAGGTIHWYSAQVKHEGFLKTDGKQYNVKKTVDFAPACFMLVKQEVFKNIGLFDENYFVYVEDADFVYRAIKKGYKIGYIPEAILWHKESSCTGKESKFSIYYNNCNKVYFCLKHYSWVQRQVVALFNFFIPCVKKYYKHGDSETRKLVKKARKDGLELYRNSRKKL